LAGIVIGRNCVIPAVVVRAAKVSARPATVLLTPLLTKPDSKPLCHSFAAAEK